ncbi:MAG: hypothetical protein P8129_20325, partial [Anaerolineae bacterium]
RLPGIVFSVWVGASLGKIGLVWWVVLFVALALAALLVWRKGEELQQAMLRLIGHLSDDGAG